MQDSKNNQNLDYDKIIKESRIDPKEGVTAPESVLVQELSGQERILGTLGNFSMIIGKAKSRKSFLMIIFTSLFLSNKTLFNFSNKLSLDKCNVLYFDTEQSRYHVQLLLRRICRLIDIEFPNNINVFSLRKHKPSNRLKIIEHIIYTTPRLGVVVIDGIRDLITSINDEEQATMISSKLLKWSEELNIHIYIVLHQNKSDNNARGHAGTEFGNKAETVLSVTKSEGDNNISIVEALMCRNMEPEPFAFEIVDGLPVLAENFEIRNQKKSSKMDISKLEGYKLFSMLNSIFSRDKTLKYSSLIEQIKYEFKNQFDKTIGDNKAKGILTHCKNNGWLLQSGLSKPYTLGEYKSIGLV